MRVLPFAALLAALTCIPRPTEAPFPPEHQLNFLNPWIEPWWQNLTKSEQKEIYAIWKGQHHGGGVEAVLVALTSAARAAARAVQAKGRYLSTKTDYLKSLLELVDEEEEARETGTFEYKTKTQVAREEAEANLQEALYWHNTAKKAMSEAVAAKIRSVKSALIGHYGASSGTTSDGSGGGKKKTFFVSTEDDDEILVAE